MQGEREPAARWEALQRLGWEERLSAMGASLRQLAPVLAVRLRLFIRRVGNGPSFLPSFPPWERIVFCFARPARFLEMKERSTRDLLCEPDPAKARHAAPPPQVLAGMRRGLCKKDVSTMTTIGVPRPVGEDAGCSDVTCTQIVMVMVDSLAPPRLAFPCLSLRCLALSCLVSSCLVHD